MIQAGSPSKAGRLLFAGVVTLRAGSLRDSTPGRDKWAASIGLDPIEIGKKIDI